MGYTPLFDSLASGTLCGKWPDIGLWALVLSLTDKHGVIDKTPTYISSITGLALGEVVACMARFCEPDPYSRSQEEGGARLRLIDPARQWGWQVVNHAKYRERARLAMREIDRVASGENRLRMAERRSTTTGPPPTHADPPSDADADSYANKEGRKSARKARIPPEWAPDAELLAWTRKVAPGLDIAAEVEKFRDHYTGKGETRASWPASWRTWVRRAPQFAPRGTKAAVTWRPPDDDEDSDA